MAIIVLDASVVIAVLDASDTLHETGLASIVEHAGDDLRVPASAYAECLVEPARRGSLARARQLIDQLGFAIEPLTREVAERAAELRAAFRSVPLPDALVVATGEVLRATEVITADRRWRRLSDRVRVANPSTKASGS